jgi:bifunctional ADP-heptose synthase (sugar kinase/adenylyltransferase)
LRYLHYAKSLGDCLLVSITGDAAIDKGDLRPYIPQELRAENLAALECVDYVVIDPNVTAASLLSITKPDVYVKGQEYATSKDPRFLAERQIVESHGGRVLFSSGQVVFSSTRLGEAMAGTEGLGDQRLAIVCRRHRIDRDRLATFLDAIRGRRVIVLGDVVIERYVLCDAGHIAGEAPMMSLNELDRKDYLGGAAFLAAQVAALGARPVFVTALGGDAMSDWARRKLIESGVDVRAAAIRHDLPIRTRFLVDEQKVLKVDCGAPCPLDSQSQREAADLLVGLADGADSALVHDSGYGVITPGLLQQLGGTFRHRIPMLAGMASEPQGDLLGFRYFDLVCTPERRLRQAMNDFGTGLSSLAYRALQSIHATQMLVTLGKRGLVTFDRPSHDPQAAGWSERLMSEFLPSLSARNIDRLGCAETVLALSSLTLARGASIMQSAYMGGLTAALQIGRLGPCVVTDDEIRRQLELRNELEPAELEEGNILWSANWIPSDDWSACVAA